MRKFSAILLVVVLGSLVSSPVLANDCRGLDGDELQCCLLDNSCYKNGSWCNFWCESHNQCLPADEAVCCDMDQSCFKNGSWCHTTVCTGTCSSYEEAACCQLAGSCYRNGSWCNIMCNDTCMPPEEGACCLQEKCWHNGRCVPCTSIMPESSTLILVGLGVGGLVLHGLWQKKQANIHAAQ